MGYVCFRCKNRIPGDVRSLFIHLRAVHHVNHAANYFQCCEIGCGRTFNYMRSFRRHLQQHENVEEVLGVPLKIQSSLSSLMLKASQQRKLRSGMRLSQRALLIGLISDIVGRLQSRTLAVFSSLGHNQIPEVYQLMVEFQDCAEPFRDLDTEYKQMQYFVKLGGFIEPVEETFRHDEVSYVQRRDSATGTVKQVVVPDTFQRVPLTRLLGQVLEMPGILQAMLDWQQRDGGVLQDVFDGEFCKTHPLFLKETSIPLILYNDDCETVNPLGSKTGTHKLGFIYFLIKSLPPDLLSSLRSHFLCAVYKSDDAKTYGLDDVLRPIVAELQFLEKEGIPVDTPTFQGVVKFSLVQVVGDNLGLNAILGYSEGFSANHMCRWCRVHKRVSEQQTLEDPAQLPATISEERAVQFTECLKNNSQPLAQVEAYMRDSCQYRAGWIRADHSKSIPEVLAMFPRLTTPGMIAQDFSILFAEPAPKLFQTWVGTNMVEYLEQAKSSRSCPFVLLLEDGMLCSQAFVVISGKAMRLRRLSQLWIPDVVSELEGTVSPAVKFLKTQIHACN
ncbi:hypothetical protein F7725_025775 [Dissostichus mawsoni]|uniref:C2H2-type domain-containing protein n=1 Tax=Dissostichus mawsoni TaxID=36200 RepID=A0A7J5X562_DISMA|nr:hypothetical protein F7725_025775 [Dissostichus mawsoni]